MGKHETDETPRQARAAVTDMPTGFVPAPIAGAMLRESRTTALEYMALEAGLMRAAADTIAEGSDDSDADKAAAGMVSEGLARHQRLLRALASGALMALAAVGIVLAPSGTGHAEAATVPAVASIEAPEPDFPPAVTYPVTLGARPVTVYVRASVYAPVARGWYCGSVYTAAGRIGGTCSIASTFPIPVTIDPRAFPVGRTFAQVVDDATDTAVANITFDARRPSRFGVGTYLDRGQGDLEVHVPVYLYSAARGWVPQVQSPVQIQELTRRGWRTRATLTTNPPGLASGIVHLGGGRHIIRAVRPAGATVWGTTGQNRLVTVTTEPLDVV